MDSRDPFKPELNVSESLLRQKKCPSPPKMLNTGHINNHHFHFLAKLNKIPHYFSIRKSSISDNKKGFYNKLANLK